MLARAQRTVSVTCGGIALLLIVQCASPRGQPAPLRVLFVGNSYTQANDLPGLLTEIAASRRRPVVTRAIVRGGATLGDQWNADTQGALREPWDAIVLQTQSMFGAAFYVNGEERVGNTASLLRDARPFADALTGRRVKLLLFAHWKRRDGPARDQAAIDAAVADAARTLGAAAVPAGLAWTMAQPAITAAALYAGDGSHPSRLGSCLAALTTYEALTGDRVESMPRDTTCGRLDPTATDAIVRAAGDAIDRWPEESARPLPPLDRPEVPSGDSVAETRSGTWSGTTELYPRSIAWPATMTLAFTTPSAATLTISFGGTPPDIVRTVTVRVEGNVLLFEDPAGFNGTIVRYRGVRRGPELTGTGEFGSADSTLHAIGRWTLTRVAERDSR